MGILLLLYTIRYLKWKQLVYRVIYRLKKLLYKDIVPKQIQIAGAENFPSIPFSTLLSDRSFQEDKNAFSFLNRTVAFAEGKVDWNYAANGKLWTYHLNYFRLLGSTDISVQKRLSIIREYAGFAAKRDGLESYPISVRGMEWIKFFSANAIYDPDLAALLYMHYKRLAHFREFHLLGNHLLENGLSLLFAAHYFDDEFFCSKSEKILFKELEEQVLPDGGHFELSPMYHCHLLGQLLSCIELVSFSGRLPNDRLALLMRQKAAQMLGWLKRFIYADGTYPMIGDATGEEAPTPDVLFAYAEKLGISFSNMEMKESGYRKWSERDWEVVMNTGFIYKGYQPGHIHADAGTFCVYVHNSPFIVDTGISTYERNERRLYERSTAAHNTVAVDQLNSIEIWSSFRVARRSKVSVVEQKGIISCSYEHFTGAYRHTRRFVRLDNGVRIEDEVYLNKKGAARVYLHFHPNVNILEIRDDTIFADGFRVTCYGFSELLIEEYLFAVGFNNLAPAKRLCASIGGSATMTIEKNT